MKKTYLFNDRVYIARRDAAGTDTSFLNIDCFGDIKRARPFNYAVNLVKRLNAKKEDYIYFLVDMSGAAIEL